MPRKSKNRRVDGEKRKEPVPSTPSGLDTPSSPFPPYSIAIFDTCALLHTKRILETTIKRNVIAVVPNTVLYELDKHASTGSEKMLQMEANRVLRSIDMLEKDPLFFAENMKNSRKEKMTGIDTSIPDDNILKCALIVHRHMSDQKRTIWFVTNDKELQLKATKCGASFIVIESQKFMDDMKMKMEMVMVTKKKRSEKMMEAGDLEKLRICLTQPKQPPESRAEKAEEKLSTRVLKREEKRAKKKNSQLQFGIFVVDTRQCSQPTAIRESPKEVQEYVPTAKKPLKPMGAYMGKKRGGPMKYELYEDDDDDSDESQLSEIWRDQRSAFHYYILL